MKPLAKALLARFGSIGRVLTADPAALRQVPGMGDASIATLKIVTQAAERLAREEAMAGDGISSWDKLLAYCRRTMAHQKLDHFRLLVLRQPHHLHPDEGPHTGPHDNHTTPKTK